MDHLQSVSAVRAGKRNRCHVCGCHVENTDRGWFRNLANKLAHKTSECPHGMWGLEGAMTDRERIQIELRIAETQAAILRTKLQIDRLPDRGTADKEGAGYHPRDAS